MFDRELLKLIGPNRKYVVYTVLLMVLGMLANIGITASICRAVALLIEGAGPTAYIWPAAALAAAIVVRYVASRCTGSLKDRLGRKVKKDLRERTYDKILKLGVRSTDGMSMAGLTQVSMEGIEQLDLYYSTYLPQFFFSMLAPVILFCICVGIDWRTSLVLWPACRSSPCPSSRSASTPKRSSPNIGASTPRWATPFWTACRASRS